MDAGLIRGIGTAVLFGAFVWLCIWAYSPARRRRFDDTARLVFDDDEAGAPAHVAMRGGRGNE